MTRSINNLKLCNFTVEGLNEGRIGLHPHDDFGEHVMPAQDIDPAALRHIELALQLRPEPLIDLTEEPVIDLRVRQRRFDFQQAIVADEPIGTASDRVIVFSLQALRLTFDAKRAGDCKLTRLQRGFEEDVCAVAGDEPRRRLAVVPAWTT